MGLKMKNVNIMGVFRGGGSQKNNIYGELPKKAAWTICRGVGKK